MLKRYTLSVVFLALLGACGGGDDDEGRASATVTYTVSGTGTTSASVTYTSANGADQQSVVNLPWTHSFTGRRNEFLYVSAQNRNSSGSLQVTLSYAGAFKSPIANGGFPIATQSATCCGE